MNLRDNRAEEIADERSQIKRDASDFYEIAISIIEAEIKPVLQQIGNCVRIPREFECPFQRRQDPGHDGWQQVAIEAKIEVDLKLGIGIERHLEIKVPNLVEA